MNLCQVRVIMWCGAPRRNSPRGASRSAVEEQALTRDGMFSIRVSIIRGPVDIAFALRLRWAAGRKRLWDH